MFRVYDMAVLNDVLIYLEDKHGRSRHVPTVLATPDKAFASVARFYKIKEENVRLPIISVMPMDPEYDPTRYNRAPIRKLRYTSDARGVYQCPHPQPYDFRYQIDFWAKHQSHMNHIIDQWTERFEGGVYVLPVKAAHLLSVYKKWAHTLPYTSAVVYDEGLADNSELEAVSKERILRKSATVKVAGWKFKQATRVPVVRNIMIVIEQEDSAGNETFLENWTLDEDGNWTLSTTEG